MVNVTTLAPTADTDAILEVIHRDGAVILKDMLSRSETDDALAEIRPYMEATNDGHDEFSGLQTTRTGALVGTPENCVHMLNQGECVPTSSTTRLGAKAASGSPT